MIFDVLGAFEDRTSELALFHRMLAGETDQRILLILEPYEKGKTCFLLRLAYECEQQRPPVPVVLLNFDQRISGLTDYLSVAREIRRSLGDKFTPAICACEDAIARGHPLVSIHPGEGDGSVDWGRHGDFKDADIANVAGRDLYQIAPLSEGPPTAARLAQQRAEMGRALCRDLARLAEVHRRVVLLVDTFEDASEETCAWLERWLFREMRRELRHVLLVVAGRPQCRTFFDPPRPWGGLAAPLHFDPFTDDEILSHFRKRGLPVSEVETSFLEIARQSPGRMAQLGDWLQQTRGGAR